MKAGMPQPMRIPAAGPAATPIPEWVDSAPPAP